MHLQDGGIFFIVWKCRANIFVSSVWIVAHVFNFSQHQNGINSTKLQYIHYLYGRYRTPVCTVDIFKTMIVLNILRWFVFAVHKWRCVFYPNSAVKLKGNLFMLNPKSAASAYWTGCLSVWRNAAHIYIINMCLVEGQRRVSYAVQCPPRVCSKMYKCFCWLSKLFTNDSL